MAFKSLADSDLMRGLCGPSRAPAAPRLPGPKIKSARSRNRAAAHAYDLAQWRAYRLAKAENDAQRQAIEDEYADRVAEGPDFISHRGGSDFSEPHTHDLDKAGKQRILTAFDQVRGWLHRNTRKPHGQAVSRGYREVLSVLLSFAVKFGKAYPSAKMIAKLACCSERTVANALAWLRMFGFLSWQRRLKRVPGRLGSVVRQTSNAYRIGLQGLASMAAGMLRGALTATTAVHPHYTRPKPRSLGLCRDVVTE